VIRETALAVACVALIVCVPGIIQGTPPPPPFYANVISTTVTQGEPILIQVVGPPNATFTVTLNPLPFNTSQPVFSQFYQLPPVAALTNGSAIGEVAVNTTLFAVSGYRLNIASANSTIFDTQIVTVGIGTATAVIEGQIEQMQFDLQENASRVLSLSYALYQERTVDLYVVILSVVLFAVLLVVIIGTRTAAGERRLMRTAKRIVHGAAFRGGAGMTAGHWATEDVVPKVNPDRIWASDLCPTCELRHTRTELLQHMKAVHRMEAAEAARYIRTSKEARREVREQMREETLPAVRHPPPRAQQPVLVISDVVKENQ
jgi:hypothetical protein